VTSEGILGDSLCTSFLEVFFSREGLVHSQRCDQTAGSLCMDTGLWFAHGLLLKDLVVLTAMKKMGVMEINPEL